MAGRRPERSAPRAGRGAAPRLGGTSLRRDPSSLRPRSPPGLSGVRPQPGPFTTRCRQLAARRGRLVASIDTRGAGAVSSSRRPFLPPRSRGATPARPRPPRPGRSRRAAFGPRRSRPRTAVSSAAAGRSAGRARSVPAPLPAGTAHRAAGTRYDRPAAAPRPRSPELERPAAGREAARPGSARAQSTHRTTRPCLL